MTGQGDTAAARRREYDEALTFAAAVASDWLDEVEERSIPPTIDAAEARRRLGETLPEHGEAVQEVLERLVAGAGDGLLAIGSPRFFGWVMGGTQPVALAADWLVSTWDQNAGLRFATPGVVAAEELAEQWIPELLGLPGEACAGFTTGATMAQFSCMAAARDEVLRRVGGDAARDGLAGAPRIRFVVGAERHATVDLAGRYLGLGAPIAVPADGQGRIDVDALRALLDESPADTAAAPAGMPTIVVLQAGNIHSGAFDDFAAAIEVAHGAGAWVHIDGAFGLWAGASPRLRHLVAGFEAADSWSTDAHKTLSVPYDCGIAIVRDPATMQRALGAHASYLQASDSALDQHERVPELSRRARGLPTWAVLRSLGTAGVAALVDRLADSARRIAEGVARLPGVEVLNEVCFTQISLALGDDAATEALSARLWADGEVLALTSRWQGRTVVRFSVSNWATDASQAERTVAAVARALAAVTAVSEASD